ncbi:MAG: tetratricopeptide repeat protein [Armatimonadetes bacterium]|nr:tetratricopeptide repeat protein [Armatimonadota bacterium]
MAGMDLTTLESAVAANPDDSTAWANLAAAYHSEGRFEPALEAFREAASRQPGDVGLWLGMGRAALELQRGDMVDMAVAQAFDVDPSHPELYRLVCDSATSPDHVADRLVGAARYLQLAPDSEDHATYVQLILDTLATVAEFEPWRAGDVLESMPYLEPVIPAEQLAPLAEQLVAARDRAVAAPDATPDLSGRLAAAEALLTTDPAEALEAFQTLASEIAAQGDDHQPPLAHAAATAYNGLALAILAGAPAAGPERAAHLALALEAAGEALARDPQIDQPYRADLETELAAVRDDLVAGSADDADSEVAADEPAGDVEETSGDPAPAELALDSAPEPAAAPEAADEAAMAPADAPRVVLAESEWLALLDEAWAEAERGNADEARVAFTTVLDRVGERRIQARALAGLGRVELALGAGDAAMQRTEEALALDTGCGQAHLVRGLLAEGKHDWLRALQAYQFAEAVLPGDGRVQRGLGIALCERGDYDDAVAPLTRAHESLPEDPAIVVALGRCFVATAQYPMAIACLEAALGMNPDAAMADTAERSLELAREAEARPVKAPPRPSKPEEEEYDPDTAPPEATRPDDDDRPVRDRVLKRADDAPDFDPDRHVRCHICRYPNPKGAERCERCSHSMAPPVPPTPRAPARPCFVATAACGDAFAPEVVTLRAWRDTVLCRSAGGRWLIRCYDRCSPPLARFIAQRRWLAALVRRRLITPLAERLSRLGAER